MNKLTNQLNTRFRRWTRKNCAPVIEMLCDLTPIDMKNTGTSRILTVKKLLLIMSLALVSGCSYKPLAIHNEDLYIGVFRNGETKELGCNYSYIQGGGVKLGLVNFGLGYFNNRKMEVDKSISQHCKSEIAEVFVVDDNVAEKASYFDNCNI